jgi:hypothetical protein
MKFLKNFFERNTQLTYRISYRYTPTIRQGVTFQLVDLAFSVRLFGIEIYSFYLIEVDHVTIRHCFSVKVKETA